MYSKLNFTFTFTILNIFSKGSVEVSSLLGASSFITKY